MMAALGFIVLASACLAAHAFPEEAVPYRNTIFGDEKIEGGVFEDVDAFKDIVLFNTADNPYRLPTTTRPKHYNILWDINIANLSFSGVVDIDLYATRANVNEIVIHAYDLNIDSLNLIRLENGATVYQTYTLQPEQHFLRVRLTSGFLEYNPATGQEQLYRLTIGFHAPLRTDMYGIYRSWYRNNHTEEVSWMASTQFQGTSARFAFPCYDEPSFKAVFDISIRRPAAFSSWSCTTLNTTDKVTSSDYETDIYHPTPIMSTYLLALIVAEYKSLPKYGINLDTDENVLKYEVIGRPSAIESGQGNYSFDIGQELLAEMSNHTAKDFYSVHPYIKMTQAAIPDFSAGAMENWGLLTYREAYLMYSEEHTNSYFKQMIAYILSHEIAHMWFGNLVTCDWWDVLWLNEGFARYYQYFLTDWVEEEMGLRTRFITEQVHTSLLSDSADNPHPLTNPGVGSPSSVSAMFSTISYNKGASVIRMTEHLMGFDNHRQGLRRYLETRAFTSALPIDLFQDLQAVALATGAISEYGPDFNIVEYYKTWTEQGGHPVLNVYVNHQTGIMTIYQRQFNINSGYATANRNWIIPITFSTASNPDFSDTKPTHIISDAISTINRSSIGDEWVIFNKQQTGFYRVNYDDYTWNLIVMHLRGPNRENVHEYNRAQIVNDVFQFARSGVMNYSRAFDILSFLRNEIEYTPWVAAINGFNWINNRLINTELEIPVNKMFLNWTETVIRNLTYDEPENESFMRSYLRYQLAPVLCRLGDPECIEVAKSKFDSLMVNDTDVPVDSRNWVYCSALRNGTFAEFGFLWTRFLEHPVYTEKIQILMVLGCTPHEESLNAFLDAIVTDNYVVRPQDYPTAFSSAVTGNEGNTQIVFRYIQKNLKKVIDAFGSATTPLSYISSRLRTIEEVNKFREWAADNQATLGTSYQAVVNAAETSISAIEWSQEVQDDIRVYLLSGDTTLEFSTPAPVVPTTLATATAALLEAPTTPDLPDSANTSFLSALVIMFAIVSNFIF